MYSIFFLKMCSYKSKFYATNVMNESIPTYHEILAHTEKLSGKRLCLRCDQLLPLDKFSQKKREFTCIIHQRARKLKIATATQEKRAFNSLRSRARFDMVMFGHKKMVLPRKELMKMLTERQIENFSEYCVIPRRPSEILTIENAVVVGTHQRRYVVGRWRRTRDFGQYERDLELLLSADNTGKN